MSHLKLKLVILLVATLASFPFSFGQAVCAADTETVPSIDEKRVRRSGAWVEGRFRFAKSPSLQTEEDGAALECDFEATGVAVRLGGHNVPAYGPPNLGRLVVTIDGENRQVFTPRSLPREIVLARRLTPGKHTVRIEHRRDVDQAGCRIESFRTWNDPRGEVRFHVSGDENAHLVDCRSILRRGEIVVRNALVRNWLTGQCSLTGLPPGADYTLEVQGAGWVTARSAIFSIDADKPTELAPIYLQRDPATIIHRIRFPRLNQPVIRRPSESFRTRFLGFDATIDEVKLTRKVDPAVISRVVPFEEDGAAAYYYDREVTVTLPPNMPVGTYDLNVKVTGGRRTGVCRSPRSVHVVKPYPADPVFVTFGHLDTSAQYQADYLERLVSVINVLAPDMVLCSNACNPAYVSGALAGLDMPYVINFGNHQFPGHEAWYGDPVGLVDFGPHVSVLNFGHPWHTDRFTAEALLASRPNTAVRVINAFEANAPFSLLDKHRVRMIHDAHGIGKKVTDFGATPTRRIGKSNSESFRIVRFQNNRVESCTYDGHETAPYPFGREQSSPLRVVFSPDNGGTQSRVTATVTNDYVEAVPRCRLTFVMPAGNYKTSRGTIETRVLSDDRKYTVITVRLDIPSRQEIRVRVEPA